MGISAARPTWRSVRSANWPLALLLAVGLSVGLGWGNDYGLSLDEAANAQAGAEALLAYAGKGDYFSLPSLDEHGPVYFMLFVSSSRAIRILLPGWTSADGRHLTNFLVFLAGVACFHFLCLRLLRRGFAWATTILFATQPLLVGHAFINQKDMPFLVLFMATILLGMVWLDHAAQDRSIRPETMDPTSSLVPRAGAQAIDGDRRRLSSRMRALLLLASALACLVALDLAFVGVLGRMGRDLIVASFNGEAPAPIQRLFSAIATDAYKTPLDLYLDKYDSTMLVVRQLLPPAIVVLLAVGWSTVLPRLGEFWGCTRKAIANPLVIAGGVVLGLLICVRQVGALAGGLVSLAILYRGRSKAIFPLVMYWSLAAIVVLATWPYLWADPIGNFTRSVFGVANFPSHTVLFEGRKLSSTDLPWRYFPTLAGLELTEPAVILVLIGSIVAIWRLFNKRTRRFRIESTLLGLWFVIPLIAVLVLSPSIYGNIRQLLFMLPPLIILAGAGLQAIGSAIRFKGASIVLAGIVVLPGILACARLHPYEYAYFNAFAGGVAGADGNYALDPWCISFREATEVANGLARPGDRLLAVPSSSQIEPFLREDVVLLPHRSELGTADMVLTCTYRDSEDWSSAGFTPVYRVEREGAVLAEVWRRIDLK
jgi:hypothetical protein